jgi:NagD protein
VGASKATKNYLIDMDGVLVSGQTLIPGAEQFIEKLKARQLSSWFNQQSSTLQRPGAQPSAWGRYPRRADLTRLWHRQLAEAAPNGTAFVIGESGLTSAIHSAGYIITEHDLTTVLGRLMRIVLRA